MPNTLVTDDQAVEAVASYHEERRGASFGWRRGGNVWAEVRLLAFDLNTGYGRVMGVCQRLAERGRLVRAPGGAAFYKLSERERAARRRREAAAARQRVDDGDGEPMAERGRRRARPHAEATRHTRLLG